jgi:hypothetical protein
LNDEGNKGITEELLNAVLREIEEVEASQNSKSTGIKL